MYGENNIFRINETKHFKSGGGEVGGQVEGGEGGTVL